jgi:HAD superfamily hydrolase (TIGR01549 family)
VPNALDRTTLKAVIFDLDGTLYRRAPLRRAMARRLVGAHILHPVSGLRTLRAISAYRRAQEELRTTPAHGDLADVQLRMAAERTGLRRDTIAREVARWVEEAPLGILGRFAQPGLHDLLVALRSRGLRLGVVSDYPAAPKLHALGIAHLFDVVMCAQDPAIGVFKPHPRGLENALARLGVDASEALYVGDRADVDAVAASAARMPCAILSRARGVQASAAFVGIRGLNELQDRLVGT